MGRNMNKSEIGEMVDLVQGDPDIKKKFSKIKIKRQASCNCLLTVTS